MYLSAILCIQFGDTLLEDTEWSVKVDQFRLSLQLFSQQWTLAGEFTLSHTPHGTIDTNEEFCEDNFDKAIEKALQAKLGG